MTQQEFILKWAATIEHVRQNKALTLVFMLDVKELATEKAKVQQNAAEELISTVDAISVMKPHTDEYAFFEIQKAIDNYRKQTK
jgi:hypothetical protein